MSRNFAPLCSFLVDKLEHEVVFFDRPRSRHDTRIQLVMPPFTALLGNASWKLARNLTPVLGATCHDIVS